MYRFAFIGACVGAFIVAYTVYFINIGTPAYLNRAILFAYVAPAYLFSGIARPLGLDQYHVAIFLNAILYSVLGAWVWKFKNSTKLFKVFTVFCVGIYMCLPFVLPKFM